MSTGIPGYIRGSIITPGPGATVEFVNRVGVMPKVFTILGQPHTVESVPPGEAMFNGAPPNAAGATDVDEQRVRIRAVGKGGLSVAQATDTFMHEFLHCLIYTAGLRHLMGWDRDAEEKTVSCIAPQLLAALRENPEVLMYLTGAYEPMAAEGDMQAKDEHTVVEHSHG